MADASLNPHSASCNRKNKSHLSPHRRGSRCPVIRQETEMWPLPAHAAPAGLWERHPLAL